MLRRLFAIAIFLGALVLGWRFAAANAESVAVDYLLGETPAVRMWVALLAAFALGAAASGAFLLYKMAKLGLVNRRQRRIVMRLEAEIHELRNLPLSSEPPAAGVQDTPLAEPAEEPVGRSA